MEKGNRLMGSSTPELHVAMFPWFAFGHIMPFVQMANKLAAGGVNVTFISAPGNAERIRAALNPPAGNPVNIHTIPIPPVDGLPADVESTNDTNTGDHSELLKLGTDKMAPDIEAILAHIRPHAVIHDFSHDWMARVAGRVGVKALYFAVFSAMAIAYCVVPARIPPGATVPSIDDMRKPPAGLKSAGLARFQAEDLLYIFMEFGGRSAYDRLVKSALNATAVVIRSCLEMEAPYIDYIEAQYQKPIILSGPIIPEPPTGELDPAIRSWLERYPEKSVIYCSFGSETHLTKEQTEELSLGLEMTNMPFMLMLNLPKGEDTASALPEGFEGRVKDRGMVRSGWVQQQLILAHPSVGCYLNHAGYGSLVEGLIHGCQLVMLPQKGDQFINSMVVCRDMEAGVEVKRRDEDGYFGRRDIYEAVEAVMGPSAAESEVGKRVRSNQKKWMDFFRDDEVNRRFTDNLVASIKQVVFG